MTRPTPGQSHAVEASKLHRRRKAHELWLATVEGRRWIANIEWFRARCAAGVGEGLDPPPQ